MPQRSYHLLGGPIEGINETYGLPIYPGGSRGAMTLKRRRFRWLRRRAAKRYRSAIQQSQGWRGFDPLPPPSDKPRWEPWQSANLWWPDDRAWFVATEIDLMSTCVGGTRECIDALPAAAELEVLETKITNGIAYASDRIMPAPGES